MPAIKRTKAPAGAGPARNPAKTSPAKASPAKRKSAGKAKAAPATVPQRTRDHKNADLSVNHVEYHVLKAGHTMEVPEKDYGYDGLISTYDPHGYVEPGVCHVQLKAVVTLPALKNSPDVIPYSLSVGHLAMWAAEIYPVYLVIFDASNEVGYWLDLKAEMKAQGIVPSKLKTQSRVLHVPKKNVFGPGTPDEWRDNKQAIYHQVQKAINP